MSIFLPRDAQKARKQIRTGTPIRPRRAVEVQYRNTLFELVALLKQSTADISRAIVAGIERSRLLALIARQMDATGTALEALAPRAAATWAQASNAANKQQVESMVARALGVEWATIMASAAIAGAVETAIAANVALIRTIGEHHWGRVIEAVTANYQGKTFAEGSLSNRLARIGSISQREARRIARDQTSKLCTSLNAIRQQDAGINRYTWRNSQDQRVVGNPAGLHPQGNAVHGDHWQREGQAFRWDQPPEDGHPGQPIHCRCTAEPIIDLDELDATYV